MPRIFISHSWEDNDISKKLAECLKRDGAEIWIDYARIFGGDSLPEVIGNAIEWCDTMVLIWSKWAASSYFVKLEWTTALTNQKRVIPCVIDHTKLPTILSGFIYLDIEDFENGYLRLAHALKLKMLSPAATIHRLRSQPANLSYDAVRKMLKKHDFFDSYKNENVTGFVNQYEIQTIKGDKVVIDKASDLMWQQGGSLENMVYKNAKKWVEELSQKGFAGFHDWRLPTLKEAMSLMESQKNKEDFYIDSRLDTKQKWIWTSDLVKGEPRAWVVNFDYGDCDDDYFYDSYYVRAVRSGQSSME